MRILIAGCALTLLTACSGTPPNNLGMNEGRLAPCPDSPNCVSSFASSTDQSVEPLKAKLDAIRDVLPKLERVKIVTSEPNYLHAEFTSRILRFVDDVEFLYDAENKVTHVRSASRVGYSDLGVNRDRVEQLRNLLAEGN